MVQKTEATCQHSDFDRPEDDLCGRRLFERQYGEPTGTVTVAESPDDEDDDSRQTVDMSEEPKGPVRERYCPIHGIQEQD